ncbi:unnamed protein product [Allacma fusca]|uniref:Uncharacterized protein n=1 Tax=Allacma fusca TaxID=39272 RepID=A0A8J2JVA1_9HEXA|nr:unnamed protein product [Allacma fusca]
MEMPRKGTMERLEARIYDMEDESSSLKSQIMALKEENQELRKKMEETLEVDGIYIDDAYRLGTNIEGQHGAVKVCFARLSERDEVLKHKRVLRNKNIPVIISPDYNKADAEKPYGPCKTQSIGDQHTPTLP